MAGHSVETDLGIIPTISPSSSPTEPNLQSFFPINPSLDDVARDVVMLSTILTKVSCGDSTTGPAHSALEIWSHIASILTTGDEHDQYGYRAVAVTGRVEPGRIVAAVVVPDVSQRDGKRGRSPVDVMKIPHSSPQETVDILEHRSYKNTVDFDDHLGDVSSIINILLIPIRPKDPEKAAISRELRTRMLFEFTVRRCWRKLLARVKIGDTVWGEHPLLTIYNYYCNPSTPLPPLEPLSFVLPSGTYVTVLQANGITADANDRDTCTYTLSDTTVCAWAGFLRSCYDHMMSTYDSLEEEQVPSQGVTTSLMCYLQGLRHAMKAGVIKRMIDFELGLSLDRNYYKGIKGVYASDLAKALNEPQNPSKTSSSNAQMSDSATDMSGNVANAEQDSHEDLKANDEDVVRHVSRYLKSLVLPCDSAKALVSYGLTLSSMSSTFDFYMVHVTPTPVAIDNLYFDNFKTKFCGLYQSVDRCINAEHALSKVQRKFNRPSPSIHAEASLMTLAAGVGVKAGRPEAKRRLEEAFEEENVAVGVSKRCCYCCQFLADLFGKDKAGVKKKFMLHGSHGTIYPWLPPPDIPVGILSEIRYNLLSALYDFVASSPGGLLSAQTSPARPDGNIPPTSPVLTLKHGYIGFW